MTKQMTRSTFLLKMILGITFSVAAGGFLGFQGEYFDKDLGSWLPAFIYTFYPLTCIVIMQWLLLSDYLPKWWVTLGIIGSAIAGTTVGIIFLFVTNEIYNSHTLEIGTLKALVSGMLLAVVSFICLGFGFRLVFAIGLAFSLLYEIDVMLISEEVELCHTQSHTMRKRVSLRPRFKETFS